MSKFDKLQKKYIDAQNSSAALLKKKEGLLEQQAQIDAERQSAAESGNTDLYLQKGKEADRVGADLYVCEAQIRKALNPVTEKEAAEAWAEYVAAANKELDKAKADIFAVRNVLLTKLRAAMAVQEKALYTREMLAEFAGQHEYAAGGSSGRYLDSLYPLNVINGLDIINERSYLHSVGLLSDIDGGRLGLLTVEHKSC